MTNGTPPVVAPAPLPATQEAPTPTPVPPRPKSQNQVPIAIYNAYHASTANTGNAAANHQQNGVVDLQKVNMKGVFASRREPCVCAELYGAWDANPCELEASAGDGEAAAVDAGRANAEAWVCDEWGGVDGAGGGVNVNGIALPSPAHLIPVRSPSTNGMRLGGCGCDVGRVLVVAAVDAGSTCAAFPFPPLAA